LQCGWHGWQSGRPWAWKLGKGNEDKGIDHGGVEENPWKGERMVRYYIGQSEARERERERGAMLLVFVAHAY